MEKHLKIINSWLKDTAKKNLNTCSLGSLYSQLLDEGYSCSDIEKLFGVPKNKIPKAIANHRKLIREDESKNQDFEIVSSWIRANSQFQFRRRDLGFLYNEFKKKGYSLSRIGRLFGVSKQAVHCATKRIDAFLETEAMLKEVS